MQWFNYVHSSSHALQLVRGSVNYKSITTGIINLNYVK